VVSTQSTTRYALTVFFFFFFFAEKKFYLCFVFMRIKMEMHVAYLLKMRYERTMD
jgi:hypothetical protein